MKIVTVREGSLHLPALLARVEGGEEVVIARDGVPIARVTGCMPAAAASAPAIRVPGSWRSLPGWETFVLDDPVFAPMTESEREEEGCT